MRGHVYQLGLLIPGASPIHRAPLWLKYAALSALCITVLVERTAWIAAGALATTVLLFALAGRRVLALWPRPFRSLGWLFALLAAHQWWLNGFDTAVGVVGGMVACLQAARLVLLTTPQSELLDGLVRVARPLRWVRCDPETFALTIAVMLRSIPAVAGSIRDVSDAAAARGLRPNPALLAGPVVVATVDFAHRTGDALAARGVMDQSEFR
ncbi:MAG: energy-coupling factor transporter transmembrane protein EcfT [Myxococcaceae bacterium]|nr:energy-coupling factor transporter transmembrane protein EcfT [Myxococcaceae bacterium]